VRLLRSLDAPYAEYYTVVVALRHAPTADPTDPTDATDGTAALRATAEARCASLREAMRAACGGDEAAVARRLEEIHAQVRGCIGTVPGDISSYLGVLNDPWWCVIGVDRWRQRSR